VSEQGDKYLSFEKVLKELQIEEDELKRLVSAGEIKAFREEDEMKFNLDEVRKLKSKPSDPDVIELLDADEDLEASSEPTMDLESAELTEELSFDDDDDSATELAGGEDEFLSDDLDVEEEVELGSIDLEEEDLLQDAAAPSRRAARDKALVRRSKIAGVTEEEEEAEPQWALGLLIASAVLLILGTIVMMDIASGSPSPLVGWLVGMFQS
jgi:hypothetical protein